MDKPPPAIVGSTTITPLTHPTAAAGHMQSFQSHIICSLSNNNNTAAPYEDFKLLTLLIVGSSIPAVTVSWTLPIQQVLLIYRGAFVGSTAQPTYHPLLTILKNTTLTTNPRRQCVRSLKQLDIIPRIMGNQQWTAAFFV
jgi:hypothetical protein